MATLILIFIVLVALVNEGTRLLNRDVVNLLQYKVNLQETLKLNIPPTIFMAVKLDDTQGVILG